MNIKFILALACVGLGISLNAMELSDNKRSADHLIIPQAKKPRTVKEFDQAIRAKDSATILAIVEKRMDTEIAEHAISRALTDGNVDLLNIIFARYYPISCWGFIRSLVHAVRIGHISAVNCFMKHLVCMGDSSPVVSLESFLKNSSLTTLNKLVLLAYGCYDGQEGDLSEEAKDFFCKAFHNIKVSGWDESEQARFIRFVRSFVIKKYARGPFCSVVGLQELFQRPDLRTYLSKKVNSIKELGKYYNYRVSKNQTLLMWTVLFNHAGGTHLLLSGNPPKRYINAEDDKGMTAFLYACLYGQVPQALSLINKGLYYQFEDEQGRTHEKLDIKSITEGMILAAKNNHVKLALYLILIAKHLPMIAS